MVSVEELLILPILNQMTIPDTYINAMNHVSVRWYPFIYDPAAWNLFALLGMDDEYYRANNAGSYALKQYIVYLSELRLDDVVVVRTCLLGYTEKKIHYMHFIVNQTRNSIAATVEALSAHADTIQRKTSSFPDWAIQKMDAMLVEHNKLNWQTSLSNCIQLKS